MLTFSHMMDAVWFKKRQRAAGVTSHDLGEALGRDRTIVSRIYNGTQKMTLEQARIFAEQLRADFAEVLEKAGLTDAPTARRLQPGLSEGDAAPWAGKPETEAEDFDAIARCFGKRPGVDVWRVTSGAMSLAGMLPGDFFLLDTHATPHAGDAVVAQVYDAASGEATTVLRRLEPPALVAASADPKDWRPFIVDGRNVAVMGKVRASWRG